MAERDAEILRYLSAIAGEVGEIKAKQDAVERKLESLEQKMDEGFAAIRHDVRHLSRKLEIMTQDLMNMRTDLRDMEARVEALEVR